MDIFVYTTECILMSTFVRELMDQISRSACSVIVCLSRFLRGGFVHYCEVVYFLAYQEGTLPLMNGHPTTTTSISLVVCALLLCCEFILNES